VKKTTKKTTTKQESTESKQADQNAISFVLSDEQISILKSISDKDPAADINHTAKKLLLETIANNWRLK